MTDKNDMSNERRIFLRGAAMTAAGAIAAPAFAQMNHGGTPKDAPQSMHGVLGAPAHRKGSPVIAMLVYPKMVMQDFVGPMTVFNLMHSEIHLVWKKYEPVVTELGLPVFPTTSFSECPKDVDILFVPGGLDGTIEHMDDPDILEFLADIGSRAKYITSDCTGALLLGAAGLLKGYKATTLWNVHDQLAIFGAIPTKERVVIDRNRMTGGGVTAGIDFALTLAAKIRGEDAAKRYQLIIEYAPDPPFNAGEPETAPKEIVENFTKARQPAADRARQKGEGVVAGWKK